MKEQMNENVEQNTVNNMQKVNGKKGIKRWQIGCIVAVVFVVALVLAISIFDNGDNAIETGYVKESSETDGGAVFNMTPDEFIANYNECIKNYASVEDDFLPKFDEWTKTGTEKTDKGNSFSSYHFQSDEAIYMISTTETGDFISFHSTYSDYTMDLSLTISAFTNKTEEKEIKAIYSYIYNMLEQDHKSGENWNCLYIEGITYTITDSTSLYSATTEEFLEGINYRKLNVSDLYAETETVKGTSEATTKETEEVKNANEYLDVVLFTDDLYTGAEFDLNIENAKIIVEEELQNLMEDSDAEWQNYGVDGDGIEMHVITSGRNWTAHIGINPNTGNVVMITIYTKYDVIANSPVMEALCTAFSKCLNEELSVETIKDIYTSVYEQDTGLSYKGTFSYMVEYEELQGLCFMAASNDKLK